MKELAAILQAGWTITRLAVDSDGMIHANAYLPGKPKLLVTGYDVEDVIRDLCAAALSYDNQTNSTK